MRRLPRKAEILKRARGISSERAVTYGLPAITPTEAELKESGVFHEARLQLMRGQEQEALAQQHRYVSDMASELNLKVLEKQSWRLFQRKYAASRWHIRGLSSLLRRPQTVSIKTPLKLRQASKPKPKRHRKPSPIISKVSIKPKRKKRQRLHTQRNGKTMRKLRKPMKNGKKRFSFPDHIWKVRKI